MSNDPRDLKTRHSYHMTEANKTSSSSNFYSKSDLNVAQSSTSASTSRTFHEKYRENVVKCSENGRGEYYKRYEHDEVPVKDYNNIDNCIKPIEKSLTDLELSKLETRIFSNVSQELQTDESSISSLESNIKFFKTTVEKIFENFYNSMRDFDHYKSRFQEILERSKGGSLNDMEEFIKDMFDHMSSENSSSNITDASNVGIKEQETCTFTSSTDTNTELTDSAGVMEAYKNENYLTDSTVDDKSCKIHKGSLKIDDIFNIFLLDGNPCVQIKLNERSLLSEINIKVPKAKTTVGSIASADNMRKVAEKKMELEEHGKQDYDVPDRDIPVKVSSAKKNIHLDEDFAPTTENTETAKSFLSKICNILCKRFRKSTVG